MSYLETETIPFDPYEILEVDRVSVFVYWTVVGAADGLMVHVDGY